MENFAKTFVSNMANGDIFYSRLSFGTIQQQFFGIFQFLKGGEFFLPPPGTQGVKKTLVLKGLKDQLQWHVLARLIIVQNFSG